MDGATAIIGGGNYFDTSLYPYRHGIAMPIAVTFGPKRRPATATCGSTKCVSERDVGHLWGGKVAPGRKAQMRDCSPSGL